MSPDDLARLPAAQKLAKAVLLFHKDRTAVRGCWSDVEMQEWRALTESKLVLTATLRALATRVEAQHDQ